MHFAYPVFLWFLLLLPLLAAYDYFWGLHARARFRFSDLSLIEKDPTPGRRDGLFFLTALRLAAVALLIFALARPQKGQTSDEALTPTTDIMLCLDTSGSMQALDFKPKNRLDAAKDVIQDFIKNRRHDRIGLVVFSGFAFTQCPLTTDYGALLALLDKVHIGMIEDGTAIGTAIATSVARLKDSEAKSKTLILLTDGRSNRGDIDPLTAAKTAAAFNIKIHAIGTGAPGGAVFPLQDPFFGTRYVQLPEDLDEGTLREIAGVSGGQYFRATDMESLKKIYKEIDKLEKTDIKVKTFTDYQDKYPLFLLIAFLLFTTEALLAQTFLRRLP